MTATTAHAYTEAEVWNLTGVPGFVVDLLRAEDVICRCIDDAAIRILNVLRRAGQLGLGVGCAETRRRLAETLCAVSATDWNAFALGWWLEDSEVAVSWAGPARFMGEFVEAFMHQAPAGITVLPLATLPTDIPTTPRGGHLDLGN